MSLESQSGSGIRLSCSSGGWFPNPGVSWLRGDGANVTAKAETRWQVEPDGRVAVRSRVEVTPAEGKSFTCRISNRRLHSARESRLLVNDDFFPRVSAWMAGFLVMVLLALAIVGLGAFAYRRVTKTLEGYKQSTSLKHVTALETTIELQKESAEEVKMNWTKDIDRIKQISQSDHEALRKAFDEERKAFGAEREKMNAEFERERQTAKAEYQKLRIEYEQWKPLVISEWERIQSHAVRVTLDGRTAFAGLEVSEDGLSVRGLETPRTEENGPECFDMSPYVLGSNAFETGRHYWEVDVANKSFWDLGVARESAPRKGSLRLTAEAGFWVLGRSGDGYEVSEAAQGSVTLTDKPRLIGVWLDCEAGEVAFYNAEGMYHLFTFRAQVLGRVRPFFWPGWDSELMAICPPKGLVD
eukprot:gi/632991103/ref/XP_007884473.1/ PREDICTED: butyrophilin-like protein 9 [Callorhinchus milii]